MEYCVGEITANAHPRALRERHVETFHFLYVTGGLGKPAVGPEGPGVFEDVRVVVVDVAAGRDDGLWSNFD